MLHFRSKANEQFLKMFLSDSSDQDLRKQLAALFVWWEAEDTKDVSLLIRYLSDLRQTRVCQDACRILAYRGKEAVSAIPALEKLVERGNPQLKNAAAEAIRNIMSDR